MQFCIARICLDGVEDFSITRIERTRVCSTWRNILPDRDDHPFAIHKEHIKGDEGVLHPKANFHGFWKNKQHPFVCWKKLNKHQAGFTFFRRFGNQYSQFCLLIIREKYYLSCSCRDNEQDNEKEKQ